ncbi:MAG: response regulator [Oscillospiraceae bacterium]
MPEKILLVEDEEKLARMVELELRYEGYEVEKAFDGRTGLDRALSGDFDLVLLDIMLPALSGMEVLRRVRKESQLPIIMLTAREEESDKVLGLELGADDYITKPFSIRELMARVKANIRRTSMGTPAAPASPNRKEFGRIAIDTELLTVYKDGTELDLTQREYELILFLAKERGKAFSREALMEHVWNYEGYVGDVRAVDVAVRRLREKLEDDPADPKFIVTRRGLGYLFAL